jgi:lipid A ethanolaminephosphotransferase
MLEFRSPLTFSLWASAFILAVFNMRYWQEAFKALGNNATLQGSLLLLNLSAFLLLGFTLVLLIIPGQKTRAVALGLVCPVAAMAAYCADNFGLPIDREMIRNIGRTDFREARGLFNYKLGLYVILLGVLPIFLIARSRVAAVSLKQQLLHVAMLACASAAMLALLYWAFPNQARTSTGSQKHLHYFLVPVSALQSVAQFSRSAFAASSASPGIDVSDAVRLERPKGSKPLLVFLVIGETARHMNFQLGGYSRPTNPQLSKVENLTYFSHVEACATTTALSVPCMLSPLDRMQFNVDKMDRGRLALHELESAGTHIQWRTNNSGSKDVQSRFTILNALEEDAFPCSPWTCLDDVLITGLEESVLQHRQDQMVVFHQAGSHGPDYFKRYPPSLEVFKPACTTNVLSECSNEQIRNAYDNTIVYTDHLLKTKIDILKKLSSEFDSLLIYISDHGESLGENGIYLHGAPYAMAPVEQIRVPLIMWISDGYAERFKLEKQCMGRQAAMPYSHANLYHTLLGSMQVTNSLYTRTRDIMAACRHP